MRSARRIVRLLTTLAGSLSVALENARLVHETRQRNAELALINSVQEALAGELEMQAIYDVVGDKIDEIFDAQGVAIAILDEATEIVSFPYLVERGERLSAEPQPLGPGFTTHVLETREPLLINEDLDAEAERYGAFVLAGEMPKSLLCVPLISGRPRDRRHLARQLRPRARVRRRGPAAAGDARRQPERGAGERAAGARDAAAERRAGADQQRPGRRWRASSSCRRSTTWSATRSRRSSTRRSVDDLDARRGNRAPGLPVRHRTGRAARARADRAARLAHATCSRREQPVLIDENVEVAGSGVRQPPSSAASGRSRPLYVPLVTGGKATGDDLAPEHRPRARVRRGRRAACWRRSRAA